ncbi:hypothetical protein [Paraburkholderia sp. C35]|nr:hypothetical protein [Paraburkholderia sp. C35]
MDNSDRLSVFDFALQLNAKAQNPKRYASRQAANKWVFDVDLTRL